MKLFLDFTVQLKENYNQLEYGNILLDTWFIRSLLHYYEDG